MTVARRIGDTLDARFRSGVRTSARTSEDGRSLRWHNGGVVCSMTGRAAEVLLNGQKVLRQVSGRDVTALSMATVMRNRPGQPR